MHEIGIDHEVLKTGCNYQTKMGYVLEKIKAGDQLASIIRESLLEKLIGQAAF